MTEQDMADAVCDSLAKRLRLRVCIPGSDMEWEQDTEYEETPRGLTMKTQFVLSAAAVAPRHGDKAYIEIVRGPSHLVGIRFSMSLEMGGRGGALMQPFVAEDKHQIYGTAFAVVRHIPGYGYLENDPDLPSEGRNVS